MPQLNPSPWFLFLVITWLIFTSVIPSLVLTFIYPNDPSAQSQKKSFLKPWHWPWH